MRLEKHPEITIVDMNEGDQNSDHVNPQSIHALWCNIN